MGRLKTDDTDRATSSLIPHPSSLRIALLLEYDGAAYGGSQRQANAPSVQAALEEAIERLTGRFARTAFAGRTDAGVHAVGQVAAFTTEARHTRETWRRALNAHLPRDVAVRAVAEVAPDFNPRRALRRTYRYCIWTAPVRTPLLGRLTWHVSGRLDHNAMVEAAGTLIGEHDFAAFGGSPGPGRSTRRRMDRADLSRAGAQATFEIEGNAFLPHQVRRTVGALVEIGRGRLAPASIARWLERPEPNAAGPTAPPHGLCLMRVTYGEDGPRFDEDA
jgi:tRNA pseudouridine38-40 synthase